MVPSNGNDPTNQLQQCTPTHTIHKVRDILRGCQKGFQRTFSIVWANSTTWQTAENLDRQNILLLIPIFFVEKS